MLGDIRAMLIGMEGGGLGRKIEWAMLVVQQFCFGNEFRGKTASGGNNRVSVLLLCGAGKTRYIPLWESKKTC
jgi:hypothetical protein